MSQDASGVGVSGGLDQYADALRQQHRLVLGYCSDARPENVTLTEARPTAD